MENLEALYRFGFMSHYSMREFKEIFRLGKYSKRMVISFYHWNIEIKNIDAALWALDYIDIGIYCDKFELIPNRICNSVEQGKWISLLSRILDEESIRKVEYSTLNNMKHIISDHKELIRLVTNELERREKIYISVIKKEELRS